jgi:hypothetical protein
LPTLPFLESIVMPLTKDAMPNSYKLSVTDGAKDIILLYSLQKGLPKNKNNIEIIKNIFLLIFLKWFVWSSLESYRSYLKEWLMSK